MFLVNFTTNFQTLLLCFSWTNSYCPTGILQNASVFSAVAMAIGNMSDRIEVYKTDTGNARILVNGKEYDMNSPSSSELKGKWWHKYEVQYL